jgi:MFS family permease
VLARLRAPGTDPEFLKLWAGGFVSTLGWHITILAMQLTAAAVLRASPFEMGLLGAAQFLPRFLFGLLAGGWVDRIRRRPLMIAADLGRAALLASVPIAFALGRLGMPQLYLVALGSGLLSVLFEVASHAYVPGLVGRDRLVESNARLSAGEAVAQIGGPNLAGAMVQLLGAPFAIALDALSYVVSAVFILSIRRPEPAMAPPARDRRMSSDICEGLAFVRRHPILRSLVGAAVNIGFFTGGIRGALIVLYLVQLGVTPIEFGLIYGTGGASALVGAVIAPRVAREVGLGRTLVGVHAVTAAFLAFVPLAGLVPPDARIPLLLVGQVGLGVFGPVWGVNSGSLQQLVTPDHLLGRVNAAHGVASAGVNPVGAIVGGWLASVVGLQLTLAVAAGGAALTALLLGLSPVRGLRGMPAAEDGDGAVFRAGADASTVRSVGSAEEGVER